MATITIITCGATQIIKTTMKIVAQSVMTRGTFYKESSTNLKSKKLNSELIYPEMGNSKVSEQLIWVRSSNSALIDVQPL